MSEYAPNSVDKVESLGGYAVIYSDPPWNYDQGGRGSTKSHYDTMSIESIKLLPVSRLASKDSVLFLWGTWPQLPVVLETMTAWGFTFKTCAFVWVKHYEKSGKKCVGCGMWTRANTEFCLLGIRGTPPRRVDKGVRQLIEAGSTETCPFTKECETQVWGDAEVILAPRQAHSAKPPEVRDRIVKLMGADLPMIELFARCVDSDGRVIPGGRVAEKWDQWGDQCDSDVVVGNQDRWKYY